MCMGRALMRDGRCAGPMIAVCTRLISASCAVASFAGSETNQHRMASPTSLGPMHSMGTGSVGPSPLGGTQKKNKATARDPSDTVREPRAARSCSTGFSRTRPRAARRISFCVSVALPGGQPGAAGPGFFCVATPIHRPDSRNNPRVQVSGRECHLGRAACASPLVWSFPIGVA